MILISPIQISWKIRNDSQTKVLLFIAAVSVGGIWLLKCHNQKKKSATKHDGRDNDHDNMVNVHGRPARKWMHGSEPSNIIELARKRFRQNLGGKINANDVTHFQWQVGGHMAQNGRPGIMRLRPSYILKPVIKDDRGMREVGFYEAVLGDSSWVHPAFTDELRSLIPQYHGVYCPPRSTYDFLVLHDMTLQFSIPCAMDIKMGTQCFEPDAPLEKRRRELTKYPDQKKQGFRLTGLRVYNEVEKRHIKMYKGELRNGNVLMKISMIFFNGKRLRVDALKESIFKLKEILRWFMGQSSLWFISSSLLLVYEGDSAKPPKVNIKMIDFAHVRNTSESDTGFIKGIQNLIKYFQQIIDDEEHFCSLMIAERSNCKINP